MWYAPKYMPPKGTLARRHLDDQIERERQALVAAAWDALMSRAVGSTGDAYLISE